MSDVRVSLRVWLDQSVSVAWVDRYDRRALLV